MRDIYALNKIAGETYHLANPPRGISKKLPADKESPESLSAMEEVWRGPVIKSAMISGKL